MTVGVAAPARSTGEQPTPLSGPRQTTRLIAVVAGVVAAAAAGFAHFAASRSIPQPAGVEEATVAANAYGLTRLNGFQVPDSLSDRVLSIHLALYNELTSAADRHESVAGALRELLLVVVLAGALALFTLCRQLGLRTATAFGVVLLSYVAPAVASAQVLGYAASVATTWLLLAAIVLSARPSAGALTRLSRALGVLLLVLAAVIEPVGLLLPVGVLAVAVITGAVFPRWGALRRGLAVSAFAVLLVGIGAVAVIAPGNVGESPVPRATVSALAVAGLLLAAAVSWRVLWARPLALGCVPLLVMALVPGGDQVPALLIAVPIIAVLLGVVIEEALTGWRRPGPVVVRGLAATLAAAAAFGLLVLPASATDTVEGSAPSELAGWLAGNLAIETTVQVEPLLWVELVRAGVPATRLQRTDDVDSDLPPAALLAERSEENAELPLIASFGEGPLAIDVRQRVNVVVLLVAAQAAEREASQEFGSNLAGNPNLSIDDAVRQDLGSGRVDSRLLTVLATAAAEFTFTIEAFPRTNGGDEVGTLRTVRIGDVAILNPATATDEPEALRLRDFFRYQLLPYRPLSQGFDAGVLVVVYSAPSPVGLLS